MFWSKNKKNRYTPRKPQFCYIYVGFKGVYNTRTCFRDVPIWVSKIFMFRLLLHQFLVIAYFYSSQATEEEESVFKSISNKNIYLNKAVNTIKRLRTEVENKASGSKTKGSPLKVSHTGMLDGAHASKTSYTLHRSGGAVKIREEDFTG